MWNGSVPKPLDTVLQAASISDHTDREFLKSQAARLVEPEPTVFTQSTRDQ
jgi:hypothetical protein